MTHLARLASMVCCIDCRGPGALACVYRPVTPPVLPPPLYLPCWASKSRTRLPRMRRAMDKGVGLPARSRLVQRIIHRLCDGTQMLLVDALLSSFIFTIAMSE